MPEHQIDETDSDGPANSGIDEWFRMRGAPKLSVRGVNRSRLAVTEVRYDGRHYGITNPYGQQDAFLIGVQFRPQPFHELWSGGKAIAVPHFDAGASLFYDLRHCEAAAMDYPFRSFQFFFSRAFFRELEQDLDAAPIDGFHPPLGAAVQDPILLRMARAVQPALDAPHESNELFASHLMLSLGIYATATYAGLKARRPASGGLSAWQERAAKELINAHIDGSLALQRIAEMCGLSTSHFAHAFKRSVGTAPHQWLLERRVERAKDLLRRGRESLIDIALSCGFADQSHFTRVFRRATGSSPGAWRLSLH